jgi:hypothetical protein
MNKNENEHLIKIVRDIAEMKVDIRYVKEHVGVMNEELGHCVERIGKLESCKVEANGVKKGEKKVYKYLTGGLTVVVAIITILYYLSCIGIHI